MTEAIPAHPSCPSRLPTRTLDQGLDFLSPFFVEHIHLVVDLDRALDGDRLIRAGRLAMDAEPVLGCRFVPRWIRPYWERLSDERLAAPCVTEAEGDPETATERFFHAPLDAETGPQLAVLHVPTTGGARLVLKAQHRCMDAGATKALAYLLADLYRRLGDQASYRPEPNLGGSRSLWQVYRRVLPGGLWALVRRHLRDSWRNYVPWRTLSWRTDVRRAEGPPYFRARHFEGARAAALDAFRRAHGATRNDLFFAAALRAIARLVAWNGRDVLRLVGTVDLRRYLPDGRAGGLCNLSGFLFPNLGRTLGADLGETLVRMKSELDAAKAALPGLAFNFFGRLLFVGLPFAAIRRMIPAAIRFQLRTGNMPTVLTNMGPIDPARLDFGDARVTRAHLIVPASRPTPAGCPFGAGISGFGDALTVSVAAFEPALPSALAERFLELLDGELPR